MEPWYWYNYRNIQHFVVTVPVVPVPKLHLETVKVGLKTGTMSGTMNTVPQKLASWLKNPPP